MLHPNSQRAVARHIPGSHTCPRRQPAADVTLGDARDRVRDLLAFCQDYRFGYNMKLGPRRSTSGLTISAGAVAARRPPKHSPATILAQCWRGDLSSGLRNPSRRASSSFLATSLTARISLTSV